MKACEPRTFLFLQGPPGPFFRQLAAALRQLGHRCRRVNLCGGDRIDWRGPAVEFAGSLAQWPTCLDALLEGEGITDIVLFGDCRPLHRTAVAVARRKGIATHVFEEGYIRPDWITLERGGVNGFSSLPGQTEAFLALASGLPPVPRHPPVPSSFRRRALEAFRHYAATWCLAWRYRGYKSHRPHPVLTELAGWTVRLLTAPVSRLRSAPVLAGLKPGSYFVLPLQLDSDHQIRTHSPFADMEAALDLIVASFACEAPSDAVLLVKQHPLDNGLKPWRRLVARAAAWHAISGRVRFVTHGDLGSLVAGSRGVVTVNSTSGTLALAAGTPVMVLGQAVYALAGVTHQGVLASFWTAPTAPQPEIYEGFRRVLACRCLLRGGFSSIAGRAMLVPEAAARLHASWGSADRTRTRDSHRQSA